MWEPTGEAEAARSRSPLRVARPRSGLPSPPTPRDAWWAHKCHNAQLRVALRQNMDGIVRAALAKREEWLASGTQP